MKLMHQLLGFEQHIVSFLSVELTMVNVKKNSPGRVPSIRSFEKGNRRATISSSMSSYSVSIPVRKKSFTQRHGIHGSCFRPCAESSKTHGFHRLPESENHNGRYTSNDSISRRI